MPPLGIEIELRRPNPGRLSFVRAKDSEGPYLRGKGPVGVTFTQLRIIAEVDRHGSIRAAALALGVREPSVSDGVRALEHELGLRLVEREGRGIRMTAAGVEFASYARQMLALAHEATRRTREKAGGPESLRLAVVSGASEILLPPILKAFRRNHPEIELTIEVGNRRVLMAHLLSRRAELALGGRPPEGHAIIGEPFWANPLIVVASADHPLAHRRRIRPARLANETWLLREEGSGTLAATREFLKLIGLEPKLAITLGSDAAVQEAAAVGLGIGFVSAQAAAPRVGADLLAPVGVVGTPLKRWWHVWYLATPAPSGAAAEFLTLLRRGPTRERNATPVPGQKTSTTTSRTSGLAARE